MHFQGSMMPPPPAFSQPPPQFGGNYPTQADHDAMVHQQFLQQQHAMFQQGHFMPTPMFQGK